MRYPSIPQLALAGLAIALLTTMGIAAATSTAAFGVYNDAWDGSSQFVTVASDQRISNELLRNGSDYRRLESTGTLTVALSPDEPYASEEVAAVSTYVREGGTLVVAADFRQPGPDLLRGIGTKATVNGLPLRDEHRYGSGPAFPIATNTSDHPYMTGVESLALNHPSAVDANGSKILAMSSEMAYLDENRNEVLDDVETVQRYPVATVESLGDGEVVVVSDPSLFINVMLQRGDNRRFVENLVNAHNRIVVDVSHTTGLPPIVRLRFLLDRLPVLQLLIGAGLVGGIAVLSLGHAPGARLRDWWRRRRGFEVDTADRTGPGISSEEVAAAIRSRHPEWDEKRVARVTEGVIGRQEKGSEDD